MSQARGTSGDLAVVTNLLDARASEKDIERYSSYIEHWRRQGGKGGGIRNYQAIDDFKAFQVIKILNNRKGETRERITEHLRASSIIGVRVGIRADDKTNSIMELVVRKWLMLNVTSPSHERLSPHTIPVHWRADESLLELVERLFPRPNNAMMLNASNCMDKDFSWKNLARYRQIRTTFTESLEDHLRLRFDGGRRVLRIFPYKQWLKAQIELSGALCPNGTVILPKALLRETIWTLDLLFPKSDAKTTKFLTDAGHPFHKVRFTEFHPVELRRYTYWRERLFDLYNELQAPPRGFYHALLDYRNPLQWWTFMLALLVVIATISFGVITIVFAYLTWKKA